VPARPDVATGQGRLLWVDVAKGACIFLVVLHHAVVKDLALQAPPALQPVAAAWVWVSMALKPVRMPLFFVLSGLVAASAVGRPWADARRRVLSPYYLYVVWLVLQGAFFSVERLLPMNRTQDLRELLGDLVWASTGLWFLFALAAYFALARLLSGLPRGPVLAVAALVSALSGYLPTDDWNRVSVVFHFTFFALGALAPDLVRRVAGAAVHVPGRLALGYVALAVLLPHLHLPRTLDLVLASALGVPLGIALCMRLAETRLAPAAAWVGRRTLPVYVLHAPLLALVLHVSDPIHDGWLGVTEVVLYPLVLTVVAVAAALAIHGELRRLGAHALFELPRRLAHPDPRSARRGAAQATVTASS
jgi:uncharacterized membrane protein YcfT